MYYQNNLSLLLYPIIRNIFHIIEYGSCVTVRSFLFLIDFDILRLQKLQKIPPPPLIQVRNGLKSEVGHKCTQFLRSTLPL